MEPVNRKEMLYDNINRKFLGQTQTQLPQEPYNREETFLKVILDNAGSGGGGGTSFKILIVETLPIIGEEGALYLIRKTSGATDDLYDEYVWINNKYELLGTKQIEGDLLFKSDILNNLTSTNTDKALAANQGKVLKDEIDKTNTSLTATTAIANEAKTDIGSVRTIANGAMSTATNASSTANAANTKAATAQTNAADAYALADTANSQIALTNAEVVKINTAAADALKAANEAKSFPLFEQYFLLVESWTTITEGEQILKYTIDDSRYISGDNGGVWQLLRDPSATEEQNLALDEAQIINIEEADGTFSLKGKGAKPTIVIPILIKIERLSKVV